MTDGHPVLAIVGATATGKTALSLEIARRVGGEIISMDSRQVYRGMDIGTAKATPEQRSTVPHHGLDLVDPDQRFSAGRFARYARDRIAEIHARGRVPILVGGTGFFLRALTNPIFREPEMDAGRRDALRSALEERDDDELRRWLRHLDPSMSERLATWGGRQRLLRALEIALLTGRPLSWWHANAEPVEPPLQPKIFVLQAPRDVLNAAIDRRVAEMADAGLVEEVARLMRLGYTESDPGMNATGYIEIIPHLRGAATLDDALDQVRRNTRAYAKRQGTWFRNQLPPGAVWLDATRPIAEWVEIIAAALDTPAPADATYDGPGTTPT
jgi:tRNA dimethylallyltransferase